MTLLKHTQGVDRVRDKGVKKRTRARCTKKDVRKERTKKEEVNFRRKPGEALFSLVHGESKKEKREREENEIYTRER